MLPLPLVFQREEGGSNSKVCVMSFSRFERFLDRIAPALILVMGSSVAAAFAAVGG
ncbi:MAG: hypothetical protein JWP23_967 [Phenylobacterium sp.]|jgi:hypothetical protein|nr:hypothetical protein [Phenylobacterium sp.]